MEAVCGSEHVGLVPLEDMDWNEGRGPPVKPVEIQEGNPKPEPVTGAPKRYQHLL
jgi:hypothetical protein